MGDFTVTVQAEAHGFHRWQLGLVLKFRQSNGNMLSPEQGENPGANPLQVGPLVEHDV